MNLRCPKCRDEKIFKRGAVPPFETNRSRVMRGGVREVVVCEPKFYICCKCGYKFNVK